MCSFCLNAVFQGCLLSASWYIVLICKYWVSAVCDHCDHLYVFFVPLTKTKANLSYILMTTSHYKPVCLNTNRTLRSFFIPTQFVLKFFGFFKFRVFSESIILEHRKQRFQNVWLTLPKLYPLKRHPYLTARSNEMDADK